MECCTQTTHGWFQRGGSLKVGLRHGSECSRTPGLIEGLVKGAWYQGRVLRTGETYR